MPNSFAARPKMLTSEYFYEYSEPHRRRPTIFEFPALTIHTATYYTENGPAAARKASDPETDERRFATFLNCFIGWTTWTRTPHSASSRHEQRTVSLDFIQGFARYLKTDHGANDGDRPRDEVHSFECAQSPNAPLAVRVEVHREYFSLTIFCRLRFDLPTGGSTVVISSDALSPVCPAFHREVQRGQSLALQPDGTYIPGVLDVVFGDVRERLLHHLNAHPLDLFATIERLFPRCTFANFHGLTMPATAMHKPGGPAPQMCRTDQGKLEAKTSYGDTQAFLSNAWPELRRVLFAPGTDDVIACYLQHGHAIYVSSLGSQSSAVEIDDLRYVLFYNGVSSAPEQLPLLEQHLWKAPDRQKNWRVSRLVYRLHEAGTLRLAGLRKLRRLRRSMVRLAGAEQHVVEHAWPNFLGLLFARHVKRTTEMLFQIGAEIGEPIQYRLSRSRYYFHRARSNVEEMGIEKIPGWQSYSEFLKRRVYLTYEQIDAMGPRMDRVLRFIQTQNDALRNAQAIFWQFMGALAAIIVLPYYVGDLFDKMNIAWPLTSGAWKDPGVGDAWKNPVGEWRTGYFAGLVGLIGIALTGTAIWGNSVMKERHKRKEARGMLTDGEDAIDNG
ncbi:hypothetical protein U91I_00857 [alpha proteobacterium U9-1i]|nr:hypothetical protein U91I_00857 [alpha proteobacterium U9-1i]